MEKDLNKIIDSQYSEIKVFTNMLSKNIHDLNNSLAVVIGQTSILQTLIKRDMITEEKITKVAARFESACESFQDKIETVRKFYKIISSETDEFQMSQIVSSVELLFLKSLLLRKIAIRSEIIEDTEIKMNSLPIYKIIENATHLHSQHAKVDTEILLTLNGKEVVITSNCGDLEQSEIDENLFWQLSQFLATKTNCVVSISKGDLLTTKIAIK